MPLTLRSSAFEHGAPLPLKCAYIGEGQNTSPPLSWTTPPAGTRELALICEDPDAPLPQPWVHWVVYSIPPQCSQIDEGTRGGDGIEGLNGWGQCAWGGPMPPPGSGVHRYFFTLFALDTNLNLKAGATKRELLRAMQGHVIEETQIIGTYVREKRNR